jgi:glycosyltransferase involved in cell wall biosynthesis
MGNARCHDFMWGYLFRYPGMVVLHDAQLHQARALQLTGCWTPRRADYVAEFQANHPETAPDVALLIAAGLGGTLFTHWPMTRLVIEQARLVVVHNRSLAQQLAERHEGRPIRAIEMGVPDPALPAPRLTSAEIRSRHAIPPDAVIVAAIGGLTPEKRLSEIVRAVAALAPALPQIYLLLVGAHADHYDVVEEARTWGLSDRVRAAGFVADEEVSAYLAAADVCACLRWPTNRETSASWLRCLAASKPTLITDLAHQCDVPVLDPRGWRVLDVRHPARDPIAVAIDLLDEQHSLQLALERLAVDAGLREVLGRSARQWWETHHRLETMVDAYETLLEDAEAIPPPDGGALPAHLRDDGSGRMRDILETLGASSRAADLLPG